MAKEKQPSFNSVDLQSRIIILERLLSFEKRACNRDNCCDPEALFQYVKSLQDKMFEDEKVMEKVIELKLDTIETVEDAQKFLNDNLKNSLYSLVHDDRETSCAQINATLYSKDFKNSLPLAEKIAARDIDDETFAKLKNAIGMSRKYMIDQLRKDYEIYAQSKLYNPLIEQQEKEIKLMIYPKDYSEPTTYKSNSGTKSFRLSVRREYEKKLRPDFNRFIGLLMRAGYMDSLSSAVKQKSLMDQTGEILKNWFPKNSEEVFDGFLQVDPKSADKERDRIDYYTKTARTVYWGALAGFLIQKYKYNKEQGNSSMTQKQLSDAVESFNRKYIPSMIEGINSMNSLGFVRADDSKSMKDLWDDTCDLQVASIHHKGPTIGSTFSIVEQEYPEIKSEEAQVRKASELANHFGNMCYIIGKNAHQRREPQNSTLDLTARPDSAFFVAEYDPKLWQEIRALLPENIRKGIEKNVSVNRNEVVLQGNFPEPESRFHEQRKVLARKIAVSANNMHKGNFLEL